MRTATLIILLLASMTTRACSQRLCHSDFVLDDRRAEFAAGVDERIASFDPMRADEAAVKSFVWSVAAFNRYEVAAGKIDSLTRRFGGLSAQSRYDVMSLVFGYDGLSSAGRDSLARNIASGDGPMNDLLAGCCLAGWGYEVPESLMTEEVASYGQGSYHRELNGEEFESLYRHCRQKGALLLVLRADRNLPGRMLIPYPTAKDPGNLPFLGRSAYDTPSFVRNGNTPCGVYALSGTGVSGNVFIGPTPCINTFLPFEVSPDGFGLGKNDWEKEIYKGLLPETLRDMPMMHQAYLAGKNGRAEIIIHGSTIDPGFFRDMAFYPLTPSMGCMTALQMWDGKTGFTLAGKDAQADLLEVLGSDIKYLYVTQVDENVMNNLK